jgi:hypothetical protein
MDVSLRTPGGFNPLFTQYSRMPEVVFGPTAPAPLLSATRVCLTTTPEALRAAAAAEGPASSCCGGRPAPDIFPFLRRSITVARHGRRFALPEYRMTPAGRPSDWNPAGRRAGAQIRRPSFDAETCVESRAITRSSTPHLASAAESDLNGAAGVDATSAVAAIETATAV